MTDSRLDKHIAAHPYPLLFATISGAHLYGFPSLDSDYDLRGCHVLPVREVIGLDTGRETIESSFTDEVLEMDLVTHDVKKFFGLLLKKNGYVLEQVYSGVRGAKGHRPRLRHEAPQPSLLRICRDAVAAVRERTAAASQAPPLRLPGASNRHSHDANRGSSGEPGAAE